MKIYHKVLFFLKILLILLMVFVRFKIIPTNAPFINIVDDTFKLLLGIFVTVISFPGRKNILQLEKEDMILLFTMGVICLVTIDYKDYIESFKAAYYRIKYRSNQPSSEYMSEERVEEFLNNF